MNENLHGGPDTVLTFTCGPEPEDIFSAVYEACLFSMSGEGAALEMEGENFQPSLFARYLHVDRDEKKARQMLEMVRRRISEEACLGAYRACSDGPPAGCGGLPGV